MEEYLVHHGIKGQKWGVRNGPPYPLTNRGIFDKKKNDFTRELIARKVDSLLPIKIDSDEMASATVIGSDYMADEFGIESQTDEEFKALSPYFDICESINERNTVKRRLNCVACAISCAIKLLDNVSSWAKDIDTGELDTIEVLRDIFTDYKEDTISVRDWSELGDKIESLGSNGKGILLLNSAVKGMSGHAVSFTVEDGKPLILDGQDGNAFFLKSPSGSYMFTCVYQASMKNLRIINLSNSKVNYNSDYIDKMLDFE